VTLLYGEVPPAVTVREGRIEHEVDLWHGQKTGLFLDQRENRAAARSYARGRLLDCFSYHGAFALQLADRCEEAIALDVSEEAVGHITRNAARNGITNLEARSANVFDALRQMERGGDRFDTIVLDPPAFAKSKDAVEKAYAGYKEINLRALKLLRPGHPGHLRAPTTSARRRRPDQCAASLDARTRRCSRNACSRAAAVLPGVPETLCIQCFIQLKPG
jgi:23S rRNA (cytosine1962-C5)-methyltransferase